MAIEENKEDDDVSFIDDDAGDTVVQVGVSSRSEPKDDKDDRLRRAEEELASLRSSIQSNQNQHFGDQRRPVMDDPYESDESNLNEREKALGISWEADRVAGKLRDPNLQSDYEKKARDIQSQRSQIAANRAIRNALPDLVQMNQAQIFRQQYGDVLNHQQASAYAKGEYQKLVAMDPSKDGPKLLDKAMNEARIAFKLAGANYMKPTDHDRAQMSGVGGGGGRQTVDNRVHMSKAEKSMAMAMYGDHFNGDEKKAYKKWASGPGLRAKREASKLKNA